MENNRIVCADCKFVREDAGMNEKDWIAYECANRKSEYHRALLNVSTDGDMLDFITWTGCPCGERSEK